MSRSIGSNIADSEAASQKSKPVSATDTLFKSVGSKERPRSQPYTRRTSTTVSANTSQRRSSSGKRNVRNSLTITSGSGTNIIVTDLQGSKSRTSGIGDFDKNRQEPEVTRHDLYKEAMYTCAHMLGTPTQIFPATQEEMSFYVHETFSESQKEQDAVIDHVRNEPFPLTIVNTRVKRAVGLVGSSKPNGYVDPYCIVTIETEDLSVVFQVGKKEWKKFSSQTPTKKELSRLRKKNLRPPAEKRPVQIYEKIPEFIKTTLHRHKKDPKWDQRFQCLALRPSVDKLTVEVWDHSIDDKYVAKAIRKSNEPDGSTEFDLDTKLQSIHSNADRKKGDIFLGRVIIHVAEVPCEGIDKWFPLMGTPQTNDAEANGKLRLQLWLVHAYRHGRHFAEIAEPTIMLGHFWDFVLQKEKAKYNDPAEWDGSIPLAATCFLFQYALQTGIGEDTHVIIRWNAYAKLDLNLNIMGDRLIDLKDVIGKKVVENGKPPPRVTASQANIEDDIMRMVQIKIVPVIRNHLREHIDVVHEALRSYKEAIEILSKFEKPFLLRKIEWLVYTALRMCILEWYEEVYKRLVPALKESQKSQYVSSIVQVVREVNGLLQHGTTKWSPEFYLTASIDYLPVVYDELQKVIIQDVEMACWIFFEFYCDHNKLRLILMENDEGHRMLSTSFFDLYSQTDKFVVFQKEIFSEGRKPYCHLNNFHRWYRPIVIFWLGYAVIRGSNMIFKTINIDNHIQDNAHALTSSSALDTVTVFCQLVIFWETLRWPDVAESYVIINFLMDVICSYTVLYAELKHSKLRKEGYYDPHGRFTISEKLCTALNNIEYVKESAQGIPEKVNYAQLEEALEEACGKSTEIISYQKKAKEKIEQTVDLVDKHIDDILENVGLRIEKEMSSFIEESFNGVLEVSNNNLEILENAMEPIIAYLEDNINTLNTALLPYNFRRALILIWNLCCRSMQMNAANFKLTGLENQVSFFKRVIQVIPSLQNYFRGGTAGLGLSPTEINSTDYKELSTLLKYFTMNTYELIDIYYYSRSQVHTNYTGEPCIGTVRVRVGYWTGKLGVEVISAADLTPHDEPLTFLKYFKKMHPTSDAMIEVELRPARTFPNENNKQTTDVKWNNLNPTFEKSFHWAIPLESCLKPSSVVVITVKDYDLLSKNAFLGEAIIPMHIIPGISNNPEPQPMTVTLHEVDKSHQVLTVLKTRNWDEAAKQFYNEQMSRFVEHLNPTYPT